MVTYATSEKGLLKSCSQIFHQQKGIINTKDSVNISLVGFSWIHCLIDMKLTLFLNICWELRRYFLRLSFGLTKNLHEILASYLNMSDPDIDYMWLWIATLATHFDGKFYRFRFRFRYRRIDAIDHQLSNSSWGHWLWI